MDDEIAFLQFGEINIERGTGGQRVRRFQPARTLDFVAPKDFGVGDDDKFGFVAKETARQASRGESGAKSVESLRDGRTGTRLRPCTILPFQISSNRCRSPSLLQKTWTA